MTLVEMEREIKALIAQYAPAGTKFRWSTAVTRFGSCAYNRNRYTGECYNFRISISKPLASRNDWETVKKTVIHEIAHARTPMHHHDAVWRAECIRLGGDGNRCYRNTEQGGEVNTIPFKYIGTCPICGKQFPRNRRTNGYHCDRNAAVVWVYNPAA